MVLRVWWCGAGSDEVTLQQQSNTWVHEEQKLRWCILSSSRVGELRSGVKRWPEWAATV